MLTLLALTQVVLAGSGTNTSFPFNDDFEAYTNNTPLDTGTNGWYGDSSNIVVQTNMVRTGTKAAAIPPTWCTLSNRFESMSPTNVWIQMDVTPYKYDVTNYPVVDTNKAVMFYVNSNGNFVVHDGPALPDPTNSEMWVVVTNFTIATNVPTWVRINIYEDFAHTNWALYADGFQVTNNIRFINPGLTNFTGFDIYNDGLTCYLDNVSVKAIDTNVANQLQLILVPSALSQNLYANAPEREDPLVQTVKVVNVWSTDIGFQVRTSQYWVAASLTNGTVTNGTTQDVVLTYADVRGWVGTSNATITVVATNGTDFWGTQTVQVALNMIALSNAFQVTPTQFSNSVWKGATPTNRTFEVRNLYDMSLSFDYTVTAEASWIASLPNAGTLGAYAATNLTLTNTEDTLNWTAGTTSNTWVYVVASNSGVLVTQRVSVAVSVLDIANVLVVTPTNLTNAAWIGDAPTNQTFIVSNRSDASFVYNVTTGANWITNSLPGGTCAAQGTSAVTLMSAKTLNWQSPGSSSWVRVTGAGATQDVGVTVNVKETQAGMSLWPASLSNVVWVGGTPTNNRRFEIRNSGGSPLNFTATLTSSCPWITGVLTTPGTVPANGTNTMTVNYGSTTAGWAAGANSNTSIKVVSTNGGGTTQFVSVALSVVDIASVLDVVPANLTNGVVTNATPVPQSFNVLNLSDANFTYRVTTGVTWLTSSTTGGLCAARGTGTVTMTYAQTTGWTPGTTSNSTVTVTSGSATKTVGVKLYIYVSGITNTIPFNDNFEQYTNLTPLVGGINGWYGDSNAIMVQQGVKRSGLQAAQIPTCVALSNPFKSSAPTNVWSQMDLMPIPNDNDITNHPVVDTNVAAMFYVNSNGNFVVHNGPASPSPTNSANWVIVTTAATVPTNGTTWVRINVYEDFANTNWTLYADGVQVTNNIRFINPNLTNFTGFDIYNENRTSYLDNVSVMASSTNIQPQLIVNPSALSQSFYVGATPPVYALVQTVQVINVWSTDVAFRLATNQAWVTATVVNAEGGPADSVVTNNSTNYLKLTYADINGWAAGVSNATVSVIATNWTVDRGSEEWGTQAVQVVLNMVNITNALYVAPTYFSNSVWKGATPTNRMFEVKNLDDLSFTYTVQTNIFWIASLPGAGTLGAFGSDLLTLTNTTNTTGWTVGMPSNATVTVTATNAASGVSATKTVQVWVSVLDISNVFVVTPMYFTNTAWIGDTPTQQTFIVSNSSDASFVYRVTNEATWSWITNWSPTGGTCAAQGTSAVTLNFKPTWGWTAGQSNSTAIVSALGGGGATQLVAMTLNVSTSALNYYMATNGANVFPYTNWNMAASTLTAAVYKANFYTNVGSVIWLSNMVYTLPNEVTLSNVTVRSVNGATNVMLNGGAFRGFRLVHTGAVLDGLTITNCKAAVGINGGAVFVSTGLVANCRLLRNTATNGGGVAVGDSGVVRNCLIWGNTATNGGGVYFDMANKIGNPSRFVESCTIASNYAILYGGGLYTATNMTGLCVNVVVYTNTTRLVSYATNWGTNVNAGLVFSNSCVSTPDAVPAGNNVNSDPLFVNVTSLDCRLRNGSLCINAGTNQAWMANAFDLAGSVRIRFGRVDIGAYEWSPYQGMRIRVNGVPYERIKLINGVEPLWINGVTNSSSAR